MTARSNAQARREIEAYISDANELGEPDEILSPSGRYHLTVRRYATGPNTWSVSRGVVRRVADGKLICDITRNLHSFHHTFVTKDGDEWLITGRSYMSQTLVNLDRGEEHEPPGDHHESTAFCWAKVMLSPDGRTLAVEGCHWACPYEYRFFDFSSPANGWPELTIEGGGIEVGSELPPRWREDGAFECYDTEGGKLVARTALRRDGDSMRALESWIDPAERERRDEAARTENEDAQWFADFRAADDLYRTIQAAIERLSLPEECVFWGQSGKNREIICYFRRGAPRASADLRWGTERGPISVQLYDSTGNRGERIELEHSVEAMERAVAIIATKFRG